MSAARSPLCEPKERRGEFVAALLVDSKARPRLVHVLARPRSKLADGRCVAANRGRDIVERHAEYIVQQECRTFERTQPLQRHEQGQRDVGNFILGLDHRLGQPGSHIGLAPPPRRFQHVEAATGDDAGQVRLRHGDLGPVGIEPAQEGILHRILGVGHGAQHAIGDADQSGPMRLERFGGIGPQAAHAALRSSAATGWRTAKPALMRL